MTTWLGVKELAKYVGVSKETIYRWIKSNKIPYFKVGKLHKFDSEQIDMAIKKGWLK